MRAGDPTNVQNQYGAIAHTVGSSTTNYTLAYDTSDNLTYDGIRTYSHDSRNRLTGFVESNETHAYTYDVIGRRIARSFGQDGNQVVTVATYVHAGGMEIGELNNAGQYTQRYIPGPGVDQREAMITVNPSTGAATARHYYHANRLGSVIALADQAGVRGDRYVYTQPAPVKAGGVETDGDETGNPFRYTGRRYDPESELYYYRARYYWPEIGRFLQTDPIGYADQMNLYAYVGNNPLNATDPTGRQTQEQQPTVVGDIIAQPMYGAADYINDQAEALANLSIQYANAATGSDAPLVDIPDSGTAPPNAATSVLRQAGYYGAMAAEAVGAPELMVDDAVRAAAAPTRPQQPYSRSLYGRTPTAADRRAVGAGQGQVADHNPPLVQRYYEGDPSVGEAPGYTMTQAQREAGGADRSRMGVQSQHDSNVQGGEMSAYSRRMRQRYFPEGDQ